MAAVGDKWKNEDSPSNRQVVRTEDELLKYDRIYVL